MENEEKNIQENIDEIQQDQLESLETVEDIDEADESLEDLQKQISGSFKEESNDFVEEKIEEIQEPQEQILKDDIQEETYEEIQENVQEEMSLADKAKAQDEFSFLDALDEKSEEIEEVVEKKVEPISTENIVTFEEDDSVDEQTDDLVTVRPVKFQQFEQTSPNRSIKKNLDIMQDISMHVSVELGRTKSSIREVMEMEEGTVVELDKIAGEQVEIFINDKLVAKGEVIVIEDKFGVRITSTNIQKQI